MRPRRTGCRKHSHFPTVAHLRLALCPRGLEEDDRNRPCRRRPRCVGGRVVDVLAGGTIIEGDKRLSNVTASCTPSPCPSATSFSTSYGPQTRQAVLGFVSSGSSRSGTTDG